jgi:hypothetical protein
VERDPNSGAPAVGDLGAGDVGDEHSLASHRYSSLRSGMNSR